MVNKLENIRYSLLFIMTKAVLELWPSVKIAGGFVTENGFYCDFDFSKDRINDNSLKKIEKKMSHIIEQNSNFKRLKMDINDAINQEKKSGQVYKQELLKDFKKKGRKKIAYYKLGDFVDFYGENQAVLTNKIKKNSFKLNKLAGAYWQGDKEKKMLTRIYGIGFENKESLDNYFKIIEEAKKIDHRKLGKELELFHFDENVGLGLPLWHPKGAILWRIIEDFWYKEHMKNGYHLVRTPHIGNKKLWETSGHWGFYNESMYPPFEIGQTLEESQKNRKIRVSEKFLLKPMNCPFHIQIFKNKPYSYRELPLRWAECGMVYRYEKKGELSGLTRVRGFTQDDAHIICASSQMEDELKKVIDFILFIYNSFGFKAKDINVYLSVRDSELKKYAGKSEGWNFTEKILEKIAKDKKLKIDKDVGGAVFYGPKLDFKIKDVIGREWQCSTLQFDFNLPERFDMTFVNSKGKKERPYILHRALFGSFERFIGLLIEHYGGAFPVWLSPVQVKIIPVAERHLKYCQKIAEELSNKEIRTELDSSDETVGNRIRKSSKEKTPYILIIGDNEMKTNKLSVRSRGSADIREISKEDFINEIRNLSPIKNVL